LIIIGKKCKSYKLNIMVGIPNTYSVNTSSYFSTPRKANISTGETYGDYEPMIWNQKFIGYVRWGLDVNGIGEPGFIVSENPENIGYNMFGYRSGDIGGYAGYSQDLNIYTRYKGDAGPDWVAGEHVMKFTLL